MENKLQELTQKLYSEGVEKANQEADKILADAKAEALKIMQNAEKDAKTIVTKAEQRATEIQKITTSEIQLAAKQTLRSVKQQVTELIVSKVIEEPVKKSFDDNKLVKEIIETAVKNWNPQKHETIDLSILLPAKLEKEFTEYFKEKSAKELNANLELTFSESIKGGFKIGPADGSYKISFTEEDFENFFKSFLRAKTIELLYQGE